MYVRAAWLFPDVSVLRRQVRCQDLETREGKGVFRIANSREKVFPLLREDPGPDPSRTSERFRWTLSESIEVGGLSPW